MYVCMCIERGLHAQSLSEAVWPDFLFPWRVLGLSEGKLLPDSSAGMTLALVLHVAFKCIEASTDRNLLGLANRQRQRAFC